MFQYGDAVDRIVCVKNLTTPTFARKPRPFGINNAANKSLILGCICEEMNSKSSRACLLCDNS